MQSGARGVREVALYEHAPVTLRPFLCEYHGVLAVGKPQYVVIDDITRGMRRPCASRRRALEKNDRKSLLLSLALSLSLFRICHEGRDALLPNARTHEALFPFRVRGML